MALITGLIEGPTGIVNMMFAVALMGFAFWKKGWLRVMMAASLIIWGTFMTAYDMKIARRSSPWARFCSLWPSSSS